MTTYNNINLRKRFKKDTGLPLVVFIDPYFDYALDRLSAKDQYENFIQMVDRLGGEQAFFSAAKTLITDMTEAIKSHEDYEKFQNFDLQSLQKEMRHSFGKHSPVFRPENDGKWFTSVDLKKANFQIMRRHYPGIFFPHNTYQEWVGSFTTDDYFIKSKQIRQVVFGQCNPKRQQSLQRALMDQVWSRLEKGLRVVGATSDELIIFHEEHPVDDLNKILIQCTAFPEVELHIKQFQLRQIEDKPYYKREFTNGSFDLKGVPAHYYLEVLAHVEGRLPVVADFTTVYDGRLVEFKESLFA